MREPIEGKDYVVVDPEARIQELEAERDRQYEETVNQIAKVGELEQVIGELRKVCEVAEVRIRELEGHLKDACADRDHWSLKAVRLEERIAKAKAILQQSSGAEGSVEDDIQHALEVLEGK